MTKRVLSGIQPSGNLTIGNYVGAIRQWIENQDQYDAYYCVVDLHAITVGHDPAALANKTREVAALYLACGLNPDTNVVFVQSHIPAHSQLEWLLTCATPLGWLYRMTQFKDKSAKQEQESVSTGLLSYPVLMAADILLYHAELVPVGDDQKQHIELTRDVAQRFNHLYGEIFTVPEGIYPTTGARIMGFDDPTTKMSKSSDAQKHAVHLLDDLKQVHKTIMSAVTDSGNEIVFSKDPEKAGVNNLLTVYQAFTGKSESEVMANLADARGYGDLKKAVAEIVVEALRPIQENYAELTDDVSYIDSILAYGAEKASEVAEKTLKEAQEAMGFLMARQTVKP
ncbi:MAG: tryptophan--tRNA ligase [Chloroflexi bacterium]|nr:tryptophan--tRNA ligase [Chloroflexota bacterium]